MGLCQPDREGLNRVRLHGPDGEALRAQFRYCTDGAWREARCAGAGPHELAVDGDPKSQELTLAIDPEQRR